MPLPLHIDLKHVFCPTLAFVGLGGDGEARGTGTGKAPHDVVT